MSGMDGPAAAPHVKVNFTLGSLEELEGGFESTGPEIITSHGLRETG